MLWVIEFLLLWRPILSGFRVLASLLLNCRAAFILASDFAARILLKTRLGLEMQLSLALLQLKALRPLLADSKPAKSLCSRLLDWPFERGIFKSLKVVRFLFSLWFTLNRRHSKASEKLELVWRSLCYMQGLLRIDLWLNQFHIGGGVHAILRKAVLVFLRLFDMEV